MGSSRLPEKTMADVFAGMPLLECVVRRFRRCSEIADVVVCTSTEVTDDVISKWCSKNHVPFFRGSEVDVLQRVYDAACHFKADAIVQMGADSAYLDSELIDTMVKQFRGSHLDYLCNDLELTYPLGIYAHVVRVSALKEICHQSDISDRDRSDVVRYIWEHPDSFRILNVKAPPSLQYPELRLTIDYPADLLQARTVYRHFGSHVFTTNQLIALFLEHPEMFRGTMQLVQQSASFVTRRT
jgi:spore coat polysaccharide biosynthesis protein SpsF